jgi:hypothetical protein
MCHSAGRQVHIKDHLLFCHVSDMHRVLTKCLIYTNRQNDGRFQEEEKDETTFAINQQ